MRRRGEGGETLVEVVVSTTLLGIIGVGIIGAIASVLISTEVDRSVSRGETVLRSYVAAVQDADYAPCGDPLSYSPDRVGFTAPPQFTAGVIKVEYWKGDGPRVVPPSAAPVTFDSGCTPDRGLQRLDLEVKSGNGRAVERVTIYKRATTTPPSS
jgi:hypothetical protein